MTTYLQVARGHIDLDLFARLVPPQCNPEPISSLNWQRGEDASLCFELSLSPHLLKAARQIIPCFSCVSRRDYGYRFALEFEPAGGGPKGLATLSSVGRMDLVPSAAEAETPPVKSAIDVFAVGAELATATLKLHLYPEDPEELKRSPALISVSASTATRAVKKTLPESDTQVDIPVPPKSQMVQDLALGPRICSPTSISMLLDHYGRATDPLKIARLAYHPQHDLYGVWPAAIYAASRWGVLGYLLKFPSWDAAQWLLDRRIPVIASIRYEEGELENAAVPRTSGHLVVVRGYTRDAVGVNDPGADSVEKVCRCYPRKAFEKVWLERTAIGYVIFPARQN